MTDNQIFLALEKKTTLRTKVVGEVEIILLVMIFQFLEIKISWT